MEDKIFVFNDNVTLTVRCEAPAPVVVNGGAYVGCVRDKGHDGLHKVEIQWPS
jgi:hypothetical protein